MHRARTRHAAFECAYVASSRDRTYSPATTGSYLAGYSSETQLGSACVRTGSQRRRERGREREEASRALTSSVTS